MARARSAPSTQTGSTGSKQPPDFQTFVDASTAGELLPPEAVAGAVPVAGALTVAAAGKAVAGIMGGFDVFNRKRQRQLREYLIETLPRLYPDHTPDEILPFVRDEMARDREFVRNQRERLQRDLLDALRIADPTERQARVQAILDREKRWTQMREQAALQRAAARTSFLSVRAESPEGAYWALGRARTHTPDCVAMSGQFWPWEVLDKIHPLLHHGCQCSLLSKAEAVRLGLMHPDQVPDVNDAMKRAAKIARDYHLSTETATGSELQEALDAILEAPITHHHRAQLRYPKGTHEGGKFLPRGGVGTPIERLLRKMIPHPGTSAAERRRDHVGEWREIAGRQVFVPEHRAFEREVAGRMFYSPPGSTEVYEQKSYVGRRSPEIPPERREHLTDTAFQQRKVWRQQAKDTAAAALAAHDEKVLPAVVGADSGTTHGGLLDAGFRTEHQKVEVAVTPPLVVRSYVHDATGARAAVHYGSKSVQKVEWDPGREQDVQPLLTRPPRSDREFLDDVFSIAHDIATKHGSTAQILRATINDKLYDTSGLHTWQGVLELGRDARPALDALFRAKAEGRDLNYAESRAVYALYRTAVHEAHHAAVPIPRHLYSSDPTARGIEEALAEELSGIDVVDVLRRQGLEDVLRWLKANPSDFKVEGSYSHYRIALARILNRGHVQPEAREDVLRILKFSFPPEQRPDGLAALLSEGGRGHMQSHEQALTAVNELFRRADRRTTSGDDLIFAPNVRPDLSDIADAPPVEVGGVAVHPGSWVDVRGNRGRVLSITHTDDGPIFDVQYGTATNPGRVERRLPAEMIDTSQVTAPEGVVPGANELRLGGDTIRPGDTVSYRNPGGRTMATVERIIRAQNFDMKDPEKGWQVEARTSEGKAVLLDAGRAEGIRKERGSRLRRSPGGERAHDIGYRSGVTAGGETGSFEIHVRGRESARHERFTSQAAAERRADELAQELGREVRVYDERKGMLADPVYRTQSRMSPSGERTPYAEPPYHVEVTGWNPQGESVSWDGRGGSEDEAIADAKQRGGITEIGDVSVLRAPEPSAFSDFGPIPDDPPSFRSVGERTYDTPDGRVTMYAIPGVRPPAWNVEWSTDYAYAVQGTGRVSGYADPIYVNIVDGAPSKKEAEALFRAEWPRMRQTMLGWESAAIQEASSVPDLISQIREGGRSGTDAYNSLMHDHGYTEIGAPTTGETTVLRRVGVDPIVVTWGDDGPTDVLSVEEADSKADFPFQGAEGHQLGGKPDVNCVYCGAKASKLVIGKRGSRAVCGSHVETAKDDPGDVVRDLDPNVRAFLAGTKAHVFKPGTARPAGMRQHGLGKAEQVEEAARDDTYGNVVRVATDVARYGKPDYGQAGWNEADGVVWWNAADYTSNDEMIEVERRFREISGVNDVVIGDESPTPEGFERIPLEVTEAFEERLHPRGRTGKWVKSWHITDNPKFALDPKHVGQVNSTLGGEMKEPGIFVSQDPEFWVNGHDYIRPFIAEIEHPAEGVEGGYYESRDQYLPARLYAKAKVTRVIPLDEFVRERYNEPGWIEEWHGTDAHGQPLPDRIPTGYRYAGPDVRDMPPDEVQRHLDRATAYIEGSERRYTMLRKFDDSGDYATDEEGRPLFGRWEWGYSATGEKRATRVEEAEFDERLHPRDRRGKWSTVLGRGYAHAAKVAAEGYAGKMQSDLERHMPAFREWAEKPMKDRDDTFYIAGVQAFKWKHDTGHDRVGFSPQGFDVEKRPQGARVGDTDEAEATLRSLVDEGMASREEVLRKGMRGIVAAEKGEYAPAYVEAEKAISANDANTKFEALKARWKIPDRVVLISEKGYGAPQGVHDVMTTAAREPKAHLTRVNALALNVAQKFEGRGWNHREDLFKPGMTTASEHSTAALLRHEWAHSLWEEMSDEQRGEFAKLVPDWDEVAKGLSQYAAGDDESRSSYAKRTSVSDGYLTETFAEMVAATTDPLYRPDEWPGWVQAGGEYVESLAP